MDEPTGDLDTKNTEKIMNLLLKLNTEKKITMVMVTHDEYMKQYATRIFNVTDGKINKVQVCDLDKRNQSIVELRNTVENYKKSIDSLGVKAGAIAEGSQLGQFTETRKIMDYPFIKHLKQKVQNEKITHI